MINAFKRLWKWFKSLFKKKKLSVKPTGTVSLVASCSSGVEPIWQPHYVRRVNLKEKK